MSSEFPPPHRVAGQNFDIIYNRNLEGDKKKETSQLNFGSKDGK